MAACLGVAVGVVGLSIYTLPFFVGPLQREFGWSRRDVFAAATAFTIGLVVTGPLVGRLIDRVGVRRVTPVSIVLYATAFYLLSRVHGQVWSLYAAYAALACLGAGTAYIAYARVLTTWFDRARGLALGITMSGPGLSAAIAPLILPSFIAEHGWRAGYLLLACLALLALPLTLMFLRERTGLAARSATAPDTRGNQPGLTLREAMRTRQFWILVTSLILVSTAIIGTNLNLVALITDRGGSTSDAARAASLFGASIVVGRLAVGVLLDRVHGAMVASGLFMGTTLSLLLLYAGSPALVPAAAILLGLAAGSESDVCGYLASRYFGLRAYSEVFGWLFSAVAMGVAIGPVLGGTVHQAFGDYQRWLLGGAVAAFTGAALCTQLGPYPDFGASTWRPTQRDRAPPRSARA